MWKSLAELLSLLWKAPEAPAHESTTDNHPSKVPAASIDDDQMQQLLERVSELTTTVARDVGQHNQSVQSISQDLTTVAQTDPSAVAAIICKLLEANQELQGRLERAEGTLQMHSRELRDAVTTARTDALTGLMNRRALDEKLNACVT